MRKALLALLVTAGAWLPGVATAQDAPERWRGSARGQAQAAPRFNGAGPNGNYQRGNWQGRQDARAPAPAQPQVQPQRQPGGQDRPFVRGGGGQRPEWNRDAGQRPDWNRPERGGWGGNRGPGAPGNDARPAEAQRPVFQRPDGQRNWRDGNRQHFNGQRPDGQRFDGQRFNGQRSDGQRFGGQGFNGQRDSRGGDRNRPSAGWQRDRADWNDQGRDDRRFNDRANWNRGWRDDNRYDWNRYRFSNRNAFHLPRYYAPSNWGYGYRRYGVGVRLNTILFSQNYWIDDPWDYRLPEAYGPYRWVRYYNDALLVDVRYGEVVDVVHDIFW